MKWNDLPKQKQLLIYMFYYEAESSNAITMSKNGDDIIAYGISKNKTSLANMLYNLRKKKLVSETILRDGSFAYPLTISGQNEAKYWIERCDEDECLPCVTEQPNNEGKNKMKFNDLKKWQKLLMYMYTHNVNEPFTDEDDVIKYGITKNKNSLRTMLDDLLKRKYIEPSADEFGFYLSDAGLNFCDYLYTAINDKYFPWEINEDDENEEVEQPNNSENNNMNNATNAMKNAFESMEKSFESMKKSFAALNNASSNANNLDRIQPYIEAIDHNITYLVTRFDTVYNAVKNGSESPNKIIERMNEIYEGGINLLIHNNNALKKVISEN